MTPWQGKVRQRKPWQGKARQGKTCLVFRRETHQLFSAHNRTVNIWKLDEMAYVGKTCKLFVITTVSLCKDRHATTSGISVGVYQNTKRICSDLVWNIILNLFQFGNACDYH